MKKKTYLTSFMMILMAANLTMQPQISTNAPSERKKSWTKRKLDEIRRMWFCLNHKDQCSKQEVTKARKWFIGGSTAVITAALIAAGIVIKAYMVSQQQKQERTLTDVNAQIQDLFDPRKGSDFSVDLKTRKINIKLFSEYSNAQPNPDLVRKYQEIFQKIINILYPYQDNLSAIKVDRQYILLITKMINSLNYHLKQFIGEPAIQRLQPKVEIQKLQKQINQLQGVEQLP